MPVWRCCVVVSVGLAWVVQFFCPKLWPVFVWWPLTGLPCKRWLPLVLVSTLDEGSGAGGTRARMGIWCLLGAGVGVGSRLPSHSAR